MPSESKEAKRCAGDDDGDVKQSCSGGDSDSGAKRAKDEEFDEDNNVVTKVMTYFFENQEFNQAFQDFAERECDLFDTEDEVEMKLEYTDVFNRFTALFESKLEAFIESQRSTVHEFYSIVQKAYEADPESTLSVYSQMLVAVCDFSVFVLMMRRTRDAMALHAARK
ncbi:hypothetical protein H257_09274 [Aphanomyces astaci]|uniref:Cilia- and flagella-associated protein 36 n=1 Tax=Aphanomyces astaci TaxID=112090 RepID=W4GAV6_APHAT|nr:hypothetical protein H257_09274 [Aphanomyces astaci]ETV76827.1 hypothetical protein H257_09274 [Aphanomyces astaci]|eukprot:XP_009833740.1 hypothetical protein H257_09274 [Aphanomyces astaci]